MVYDGGAAFPFLPEAAVARQGFPIERGMSLRDWFAGQALSGALAASVHGSNDQDWTAEEIRTRMSALCYELADAMLEAREEPA